MGAMHVTVASATAADESVMRNLVQFYAYDFADFMDWDLPDSGRFPDTVIDGCFAGTQRQPFLLRVDGRLVGFAIVELRSYLTGDPGVHDVAEFFVTRRYRARGVGSAAAQALFNRFGGRWEVRQTQKNIGALAFWRKVIARYTGDCYTESFHNDARWRGSVQTFSCPATPRDD